MDWKRSNSNYNVNRHDKVVLRNTCINNVDIKIIKITTGFQYVGYVYYSANLNWADWARKNVDWAACSRRAASCTKLH